MNDPLIFEFGSRAGSYFALAVFSVMFAALGIGVAVALLRRGIARRAALAAGGVAFVVLTMLVYVSSLRGFYAVDLRGSEVVFHYLHPVPNSVPFSAIVAVESRPAFRGRWRLFVVDANGDSYPSATWDPETVQAHAQRIRELIAPTPAGP